MNNVIFLETNAGFPVEYEGGVINPIPVVDGFIVSISLLSVIEQMSGIEFQEKAMEDVSFLPTTELDECERCHRHIEPEKILDEGHCVVCEGAKTGDYIKMQRQTNIDYLIEQSTNTPAKQVVLILLERYAKEVISYVQTGSGSLKAAVENETEETFASYLAIELLPGFTIKMSILKRIS